MYIVTNYLMLTSMQQESVINILRFFVIYLFSQVRIWFGQHEKQILKVRKPSPATFNFFSSFLQINGIINPLMKTYCIKYQRKTQITL